MQQTVERPEDAQTVWAQCAGSFLQFLVHARVLEPPPGLGIIPFAPWAHILNLVRLLLTERLIVILKARQLGVSWLLAAYALWIVMFQRGAVVLMISKGQRDSRDLLAKSSFIHAHLPAWMQMTTDPDNTEELGFPAMLSTIVALPSTKNAGRSITATVVIADEEDFHPFAEDNYGAVKPTIDAGGQFIAASTIDKTRLESTFRGLYLGAMEGTNGFVRRFYGWACRPGRTPAWYEAQRKEFSKTPHLLEQEYPATEEEALSPAKALQAFDQAALVDLRSLCRPPIATYGPIRIWQHKIVSHSYVAASDTSHGVGQDEAVTVILDRQSAMVVADIQSAYLPPWDLADWSLKLLDHYDKPLWGIEDNDWGIEVVRKAVEAEYSNLFYQDWLKDPDKNNKPGWHTGPTTRFLLWGDLQEAISARAVVIPSKEGLAQFFTVIRNPEKQGRVEGMAGTHDDYPLAMGIAVQMLKHRRIPGDALEGWRW